MDLSNRVLLKRVKFVCLNRFFYLLHRVVKQLRVCKLEVGPIEVKLDVCGDLVDTREKRLIKIELLYVKFDLSALNSVQVVSQCG